MRPTNLLLSVVALFGLAALLWPDNEYWSVPIGALLAALIIDYLMLRSATVPEVERQVAPQLAVNQQTQVTLVLKNSGSTATRLNVFDELPDRCDLIDSAFPIKVDLPAGGRVELKYTFTPLLRGDLEFGQVVLLQRSPFGFWRSRRCQLSPSLVRVYPDFSLISAYLDLVADRRAVQLGIKLTPRRGEGLEFHQLREYRDGDSIRQIDWKATSRRQTLISREYQEERDQRLLFLIDSGRRMRTLDGSLSHFDYALNAMMLLAYIALRQGDTVALKVFGHEGRWVPAQRGVASINLLLNETYDLHTGTEPADFLSAAEEVMTRQRKRSMVVLLTNLREEDADLLPALKLLKRRHLVVLANLRESALDEVSVLTPGNFTQALQVAGTHSYLAMRRQYQADCASVVDALLDCTPEALPVSVVNAYWQIKRSGSL